MDNNATRRIFAKLFGYGTCLAFAAGGLVVVALLLILGLWAGFNRLTFVLVFVGAAIYVVGTAALGYRFARQPRTWQGIALAVLWAPVVAMLLYGQQQVSRLEDLADTFATSNDRQAVLQAEQELIATGRRSGRQPHVSRLLHHLKNASMDRQRLRLVRLLGGLSYQYEPLLAELRALHAATEGDNSHTELHDALRVAILAINPYEETQASARYQASRCHRTLSA